MTVPVQTTFTSSIANGVTTTFPYSFKITDADDLAVYVAGVLVTTGFTVSGVGNDLGGNVEFTVAPANGATVIRALSPVLSRDTDYQQFGDWLAENVNNDFDRIWLALQSQAHDFSRALKLPIDTLDDQVIVGSSADRANKYIAFDSSGNLTLASSVDPGALIVSSFMETLLDDMDAATARATLGLIIGTNVQAYAALASQAEMEAGTETAIRSMSPLRVKQAIQALASIPVGAFNYETSVYQVSGQSIPNATSTVLNFDAEDWDDLSLHSTVTNNSRITISASGRYEVYGYAVLGSAANGAKFLYILKNGAAVARATSQNGVNITDDALSVVTSLNLSSGDYLQISYRQDVGSSQSLSDARFKVRRLQ